MARRALPRQAGSHAAGTAPEAARAAPLRGAPIARPPAAGVPAGTVRRGRLRRRRDDRYLADLGCRADRRLRVGTRLPAVTHASRAPLDQRMVGLPKRPVKT